jgi:molybdopterin synthase catalytic subunit
LSKIFKKQFIFRPIKIDSKEKMTPKILLSNQPLDVLLCISEVENTASGGIDVFIGTVREATKCRRVVRLEFEGYEKMAIREMTKIALEAAEKWPIQAISMHHRLGTLAIGEVAVVIAVSAAHREAAFDACRFAIDSLKKTVPIWKKEVFEDGEIWVAAHP